jgi:colanic acid biosynthesis glycosyl transferase WcaI
MFSIAPSLMSAAAVALAARSVKAASWLHLQDFEVDAAFDLGILRNRRLRAPMLRVERGILRAFDRVSSIAPEMTHRLQSKGVDPRKIREIRNWTDTGDIVPGDRMTDFRHELGLSDRDVVVLYSGTMSNKQGLELIVEAAREVALSHANVKFIMSGEGPHKSELQALAADLRNVRFLALQPDKRFAKLMATADIHVIPQRAEVASSVLPSKLGGIFASGRPVIAMAASGTGLAHEVEGVGVIVPPGDAHALAAAIRGLVANDGMRLDLGRAARLRALERWDREQILSSWNNELGELCDRNRLMALTNRDLDARRKHSLMVGPSAAPVSRDLRRAASLDER